MSATQGQLMPTAVVRTLLCALITLIAVVFVLDVPSRLGAVLWTEQVALVVLGLSAAGIYLLPRGGAASETGAPAGPGIAGIVLAAASLAAFLPLAWQYEHLLAIGYLGTGAGYWVALGLALAALLLLVEALRRSIGLAMVVLTVALFVYALFAGDAPGVFAGRSQPFDFLVAYLVLDTSGMVGIPISVVISTVAPFILFGSAFFRLGGGELFINLALALTGRFHGGAAKASIVASAMFGSVSGSAGANVATTGLMTIPLMKRSGFSAERAAAVEAVASTGGQLLPPIMGAAAFIMADFLAVPYTDVVKAATIPALLYFATAFLQIQFYARRNNLQPLSADERPKVGTALRRHWPMLLPLALLLYFLLWDGMPPATAAMIATAAVLVAGALGPGIRFTPSVVLEILAGTGRTLIDVAVICGIAGVVIGALSVTGLSFSLVLGVLDVAGGSLLLLLLVTAAASIVLGMGMPTTAVYILLATMLAPALVKAGVLPMAAHLFVLYFGAISMITPPVCLASFAAASIAGSKRFMTVGFLSTRLGITAFIVPFAFVVDPALIGQGDGWLSTAYHIVLVTAGCALIGSATEGHFLRQLGWLARLPLLLGGLVMFLPADLTVAGTAAPVIKVAVLAVALAAAAVMWRGQIRHGRAAGTHADATGHRSQ